MLAPVWSLSVLVLLAADPAPAAPVRERVLAASARLIGTPYVHSPLGEGSGVDPDPLVRFDAVDCLTFVEESLALGAAPAPDQVPHLLSQIRYADRISYEGRNHLMEAQWLPNNVRKGFLRDVTRSFGGEAAVRMEKVITASTWASQSSRLLDLSEEHRPVGTFGLEVLPLKETLASLDRIPPGTILLVVREDRPGKVTRITHLGFVVQKKGRTYLRHAARNYYRRVVDEDLRTFLTRNSKYTRWPVVGVSLLEPSSPPVEAPGGATAAAR